MTKALELLAPAKNLEQGMAAISHGADAVYIGAPSFGARQAAGNSIEDIEALVKYAHLYGSKVFATVNTLLFDDELKAAEELMWSLYNVGVDAAIVQDMGLLETNLPPIELHASTQTHNLDPRRIKFLEQVGFKRIILARETSLEQMKQLRKEVTADLEAFVQGALCVCYSGQCYMSQYLTGRSGNRGACSQPCRSSYNLLNASGKVLKRDEHLLSLKDFSALQHLESMIDAGITSFKIEGRLKDSSYVKNVTAFYRKRLDEIIEHHDGVKASSSGRTIFFFEPDLERTFNRGFTDYFLAKRKPMASHATQKSIGKKIGKVVSCKGNVLVTKLLEPLHTGDGICYLNNENKLDGFLVNRVEGNKIFSNKKLEIKAETILWRNNDYAFEKQLQGDTSERKIAVSLQLKPSIQGLVLKIKDEDGITATSELEIAQEPARDQEKMRASIITQLSKLGGTPFETNNIEIVLGKKTYRDEEQNNKSDEEVEIPFIPSSMLNQLRRDAIDALTKQRIEHFKPNDSMLTLNETPYYEASIDYRANVVNHKAESFYKRHRVTTIEWGIDQPGFFEDKKNMGKALMTTKYCLRYELQQCLQHKCNKEINPDYKEDLFLENNGKRFRLHFDCKRCEMQLFAE